MPAAAPATPGDRNATGLTQQVDGLTGWEPDTPHQPNLSFVPYVLTGDRWMLDNQRRRRPTTSSASGR